METGLPVRTPSTREGKELGFHGNLPTQSLQLQPLLGP